MTLDLTQKKCVPCEGGMPPMKTEEATRLQKEVAQWQLVKAEGMDALERKFTFKDFAEAMKFVNKVAGLAESEGHHPNIDIRWNKVKLTLWTHAIGGLSENDFIVAAKVDRLT